MDEIISILHDPQKIEQLILKLKTIGENSHNCKLLNKHGCTSNKYFTTYLEIF